MPRIVCKTQLAPAIYELVIEEAQVALKAQAGHFVIVMADEHAERIPLTIADYDRGRGEVTLVLMTVGKSSHKLSRLEEGEDLYALIGPLGHPSEIKDFGTVIMVAGGVGTAPVYPIARTLKEQGNRVISIQGARSAELVFWQEKLASVSDRHILTTDNGTAGRKGLVTEPLKELLESEEGIGCVYSIGPAVMMRACAEVTRPFGARTIVSLNTVMVDGTGMCGGCRVRVGEEVLFTCVDGPEFDGHQVDWSSVLTRQRIYHSEEKCSLDRYMAEVDGVAAEQVSGTGATVRGSEG